MGDGVTDLARRGLPGGPGPRMDGCCDTCGEPLPEKGVLWEAPSEKCVWKYHIPCAPKYLQEKLKDHRAKLAEEAEQVE